MWIFLIGCISFIYAGAIADTKETQIFWMWIAIFSLGGIGVSVFFLATKQMKSIRKLHQDTCDKQLKMEHSQSVFLASMSENIHDIIEENFTAKFNKSNKTHPAEVKRDNKLLDISNDLIEFLRLKSKKVKVINGKFNLNNVLNEVSGSICSSFKGSNVELVFDIDNNIPRDLIGDSLNLEKVLHNLLENAMSQIDDGEIKLEIAMFGSYEKKIELQFKLIDTGAGLSPEKIETLFIPYYNEENNQYSGLGLYVAKELISIMNGEIIVQSTEGKGTTFALSLPFSMEDPSNRRNYRLPEKVLTSKKVFIVDSNYNSALAIKKMFSYFRHDVKIVTKEDFVKKMYNLTLYDIVILDEELFNIRTVDYLNKIKKDKELKVIVLHALLKKDENDSLHQVVDRSLVKPLNQERVFELIVDMYDINLRQMALDDKKEEVISGALEVHRSSIVETLNVDRESFSDFNGMNLLIVEDNIINQKVLVNILSFSKINIDIANDGREAADMVKVNEGKYDLILMDINMPIMDGYAATEMIRSWSEFDSLPIVAFTALVLDSEKQKIFNSGMNAFLAKPLELGKLYTVFKIFFTKTSHIRPAVEKSKEPKRVVDTNILDIAIGIKYSSNNEAFYMEILKEFMDAYGESAELFTKLVREHRYEQVKMLFLDMKGLTATIGAKDMYALINNINQCMIYNKKEELVNYTDSYTKELQKLDEVIKYYRISAIKASF